MNIVRIADMTNVWENVISHLESLGYDRKLQILPDLYDYIDERCPGALVVSETATDEAYDHGFNEGFSHGYTCYDKGYEAGVAWGYKDGKADGIEEGYERGYAEGFDEKSCSKV
jgi:hypothetical protein